MSKASRKNIETTWTVIPVIGASTTETLIMFSKPSLKDLRELVEPHLEGQKLERVRVFVDGAYADMFVGENSAGGIRNVRATEIYRNNWLTHNPGTDPESLPAISGPAVLVDRVIWF